MRPGFNFTKLNKYGYSSDENYFKGRRYATCSQKGNIASRFVITVPKIPQYLVGLDTLTSV